MAFFFLVSLQTGAVHRQSRSFFLRKSSLDTIADMLRGVGVSPKPPPFCAGVVWLELARVFCMLSKSL